MWVGRNMGEDYDGDGGALLHFYLSLSRARTSVAGCTWLRNTAEIAARSLGTWSVWPRNTNESYTELTPKRGE